ncbi:MAG: C4-dicarboxylate transporter/malic acid transport protein [Modestobacter sp.]|nr:C4-dicarboxylate transporter/malic acid transport protein [Modestobacter sp.]
MGGDLIGQSTAVRLDVVTGALLIPHTAPGQLRLTLFSLRWSMFGLSLLASLVVITLLWGRLARHKVGAAAAVPTLWIVLGPLGQSITAANNVGAQAHLAVPAPFSTAFQALGLVYGLPVWGFRHDAGRSPSPSPCAPRGSTCPSR